MNNMIYSFTPLPMPFYYDAVISVAVLSLIPLMLISGLILIFFWDSDFYSMRWGSHRDRFLCITWALCTFAIWISCSLGFGLANPTPQPLNKKVVATYVTTTAADFYNRTSGKTPRDSWEHSVYVTYKLDTGEQVILPAVKNFAYPNMVYLYGN